MSFSGHGNHERRPIVGLQRQGIAAEFTGLLHAPHVGALQRFGDEGVLVGAEVSLRSDRAFARLAHRCEIQKGVAVAFGKILEQPRDLRLGDGIFDIADAHEREDAPLADQLLGQVCLEELDFLGQGAGELGLLDALGVHQFFLAEVQHLPVVQADGQRANQQQRAQH